MTVQIIESINREENRRDKNDKIEIIKMVWIWVKLGLWYMQKWVNLTMSSC